MRALVIGPMYVAIDSESVLTGCKCHVYVEARSRCNNRIHAAGHAGRGFAVHDNSNRSGKKYFFSYLVAIVQNLLAVG